ncbi:nitrite extrusion protein 2 [Escherichia coli KOEGE 44 (106a)]|nr:nitrite extrusion protein 2 [Escherichia coli KOEGE 44 (106a)]
MALQNEKNSRYLLRDWKPENPAFWENKGKHIARRNLWISVSCLLFAFCVWMLFSAVTVNLNKIGFNFTTDQLFLLTALPSVSGALLRVPYSFMVPIFGGRRWTIYRYRFAMRFCRCELCFEHGQYQFLLSKSQTRERSWD